MFAELVGNWEGMFYFMVFYGIYDMSTCDTIHSTDVGR